MLVYLKRIIINIILYFLYKVYHIKSILFPNTSIIFWPHSGMCKCDKYDIINYKSDSAFTFFNYLVENKLEINRRFYIIISDQTDIRRLNEYINKKFPYYDIRLIDYFKSEQLSLINYLQNEILINQVISDSEFIFTSSIESDIEKYIINQKIVDLGYYSIPFKNDILEKSSSIYTGLNNVGKSVYKYIATSELAIRLILPSMSIPYERYVNLGMCRNDNLIRNEDLSDLKMLITSKVSYQVNKLILFIPTHKDYEQNISGISRALLGFDTNYIELNNFLQQNGILLIAKIHPKQNSEILSKVLPESILIHTGNPDYGLTELMLISDGLITDYTSGYFDYLLLDKPVIFNFFDLDIYKSSRGLSYEPIESIIAGDIINDQNELMTALLNIEYNKIQFKEKRAFLRNLFFSFQDSKSCERVYKYFFN